MAAPAPTAAVAAPPPLNPQYGADVNAAQRNFGATLQQTAAQRAQLGGTYGFGVDAAGNVIDDHTNPFSRAAALQTSFDNSERGSTNSYAARGQLYSGALNNAHTFNATTNLRGRDELIRDFMSQRYNLDVSDLNARNAYDNAVDSAAAANAQYAIDNPPAVDTVAASAAAGAAPRGYVDKPGVDSKGNRGVWRIHPDGRKVFIRG